MPEGPEVKRITEKISNYVLGEKILSIKVLSGRYVTHGPPQGFEQFSSRLPATIVDVNCKGKFIYVVFDNGFNMWNTLGMSGGWSPVPKKHSRLKFDFDSGSVYFNDMRNFGTLKFTQGKSSLDEKLQKLGPDMLSEDVSSDLFRTCIWKKSSKTVTQVIMDQSVISGVGNYLKSEALYLAGISPHRVVSSLTAAEIANLNSAIKSTIRSSYASGGATIHTFLDFDGEKGKYSRRFAVYNQKYDINGNVVLREKTRDGRTSFWVPELQK